MISLMPLMKTRLAQHAQTLCTIIRIARQDGNVFGFTDHDQDIIFDDGSGSVTYHAAVGYTPKDVAQADDMSVDNSEYDGILNSPSITEADLHAGLWDYAAIRVSYIDWAELSRVYPITSISRFGTVATAVVPSLNGLSIGDSVTVSGAVPSGYDGTFTITATALTPSFSYTVSGSLTTPATGTITYQINLGVVRLPGWKLGQVTVMRNQFTAEIRGIMQAYSRTIGELTQPGCRANLGDARCKVNLAGQDQQGHNLTVTGTLTGVSADQMTLYDTSRTEPGPTGGVLIAAITKSNPGQVTLATGGGASFFNNEAVSIAGCVAGDFVTLNANTIIRSLSGDTFNLGIDTTAFVGTYTANSGTLTPLGGNSGFFDFGTIKMTSGLANGYTADVLSYVPGQWQLQLPFPYAVAIGDTYTMIAGCDKSLSTCLNRYANVANMRAEPYLPGIDKIVQVGKQQGSTSG